MTLPALSALHVDKAYGAVRALQDAHLEAHAGEVHGLLGPNGSGKSTLNKVLAGTVRADKATIHIEGQLVRIDSPTSAHRLGIDAVHQQPSVLTNLTVEQNLLLGSEFSRAGMVRDHQMRARAADMLERIRDAVGPEVEVDTPASNLGPGQLQLIEISKVLLRSPKILILDEATASLHRGQVEILFELVEEVRREGTCVVFVSHRLDEVMQLCDRVTVLRSGKTVATVEVAETTPEQLVTLMVGDKGAVARRPDRGADDRPDKLSVHDLTSEKLRRVSFSLGEGEVLGLGGLQGQGQSDLLMTLFGQERKAAGEIILDGATVHVRSPHAAARHGIALVPGDRTTQGLFSTRPVLQNLSIASLWRRLLARFFVSIRRERTAGETMIERLDIVLGSLDDSASGLSGGNAQKVVVARWLLNEPSVVLLDDPTKGVDVGAKGDFYEIIDDLARQGVGVVLNSSEDRELVRLCDRVLVMYEGHIRRELLGAEITEENLVSAALLVGESDQSEGRLP